MKTKMIIPNHAILRLEKEEVVVEGTAYREPFAALFFNQRKMPRNACKKIKKKLPMEMV